MQIKIIIKTQRLTLSSNKIVCGTNNFIECLFDFQSSDWTELEKWALFKDGQNTYEMYIQDNKCIIPAQCISAQGEVIMSVVGRNNGKNITATAEDKLLLISGRAFDNPDEERLTPTYLEEVLGKVRDESLKAATSEANAAQSAQEAADSAAAALQSEKNAKASEKAAETSKEAAAQSEANSKTSEDAARGYADDAEASKGATTALTWNRLISTSGIYYALVANQARSTTNYNCSYYTPSPKYYNQLNDMEITGNGGEGKACWIKNTAIGSLDDLKASLQGVLLYYELATPIVTVTEVDNRFDAVDCKAGDKITFVGNSDYHLPVPNEEEYLIALNEVTA